MTRADPPSGRVPLGELLIRQGRISPEVRDRRLEEHREAGVPLGRVLMSHGDISRRELWQALSSAWDLPVVDLIAEPPDPDVLHLVDADELLAGRWVPVRVDDVAGVRTALVAVCDEPRPALAEQLATRLGVDRVEFAATTDWDVEQAILVGFSEQLVTRAAFELAEHRPELSAADPVVRWQQVAGLVLPAALAIGAVLSWRATLLVVLLVLNLVFAVGVAFKLVTCLIGMATLRRSLRLDDEVDEFAEPAPTVDRRGRWTGARSRADGPRTTDRPGRPLRSGRTPGWDLPAAELPTFTILVPVFREANVISDVVAHVAALDYPMSKLQVLVLLEADDHETIEAAKAAAPPDFVRLVVVPPGGPQTKPKACNVGLAMAEGEFLVIYDAEDRPEPGQLREVAAAFRDAPAHTVCVQARLNYFNAGTNILTRMFTLEYSMWFDTMLPGLDRLRLPIPLGGTSNHFRVSALRELGGWDPFNVTEDADLGVRASALGLRVGIIDSTTWEEACSEWRAWIRQRTRWIKGYMVTTLVHLRRPVRAARVLGLRGMIGLIGLIAGTPLLFLAAPLMWAFFLYTFLGGVVPQFALPGWIGAVTFFTLAIGNGSMILITALAARRRRNSRLAAYALLNPAYWVLHSIAAWRALYQLVVSPSHWEKTPHGIEHGPMSARGGSEAVSASGASADDRW